MSYNLNNNLRNKKIIKDFRKKKKNKAAGQKQ